MIVYKLNSLIFWLDRTNDISKFPYFFQFIATFNSSYINMRFYLNLFGVDEDEKEIQ